jgi:hypothetical protein
LPTSPRTGLTEPRAIIARMAEDLNDLRREQGSVTQPSLMARGWTPGQLRKHYLAALEEAVRTYSETKVEPAYNPDLPQNAPFESFNAEMRRKLAAHEALSAGPFPVRQQISVSDDANEVA